MHQKLPPDPFLILLNNPKQPLHTINSFKNKVFWKRTIKKPLKSLLIFSVPFNGQSYQKQKRSETRHQSLFRSQNKFRKITLFVAYYLTNSDDANYICKFIQVDSWHRKLFHFHLSLRIWKVWKESEKNHKNLNISRMKRAF